MAAFCKGATGGKTADDGILWCGPPSTWKPWVAAFVQRLRELGWVDGQTIAIEYRWAEGRSERFEEIMAEFVRLNVNVIVTGGIAVPAAKRATSVIPIVFTLAPDPVGSGLVAGKGAVASRGLPFQALANT
jgi:putative tryptophan/tyrosine transport system substrate-binding protein